ncbi:MAG: helix-turn-helix domain-containing protein, partial [Bacteroidota bacterium]|nr:helix-turn-helix domain-containing protein [Bacteroidota bacterium]
TYLRLMKEVAIIVPHRALLSSIEDARNSFQVVNEYFRKQGLKPIFNISLVGLTKEISIEKGRYSLIVDKTISEKYSPQLIIIPSLTGDMITPLSLNINYNPWLINMYKQGSELASLCLGSFILASTGLLKNQGCSTHWLYANEFRAFFPGVQLHPDEIITDHNGIYTSGGSTLYWNLLLHLIEKYAGKETAIWVAKYFALDISRNSQAPFAIFNGQKEHSDKEVLNTQEYIEAHFREKLTVDELAHRVNLGRRTLERRFRNATSNTILEYVQRVKMEASKKGLETGRKTITEVMYDAGYVNINAFRKVFKTCTGMSPLEYRRKYTRSSGSTGA